MDENGSRCVWCELASFGFCVNEEQAQIIKQRLPGLECDDDSNDDDAAPEDDDDNVVPDDYWTCLKEGTDEASCSGAGCVWCVSINHKHCIDLFGYLFAHYKELNNTFSILFEYRIPRVDMVSA
jgi:hypothetical protein